MKRFLPSIVLALVAYLIGCEETHFPIDSLPQGSVYSKIGDTVYVVQNPVWTGFNHPQGIIVGHEPFIYVADTDNDRIVMLDLIGRVIGYSQKIKHPVALTEDWRLQLIVCAQFDTLLPGKQAPTTVGAVYRLDLVSTNHDISSRSGIYPGINAIPVKSGEVEGAFPHVMGIFHRCFCYFTPMLLDNKRVRLIRKEV